MIDPAVEKPFPPLAPQHWSVWLSAFVASHVLAFGTHWTAMDYVDEAAERLRAGETLPFPTGEDYYNQLLRSLLSPGRLTEGEAAVHYTSSRGLFVPLQQASLTIAEAAARAQVITRARRTPNGDFHQLPAHEWQDRERFRFGRSHLFRRGEMPLQTIEWWDVQFWAEDVYELRRSGLGPPPRPMPVSAKVFDFGAAETAAPVPSRFSFTIDPANLRLAIERSGQPAPSKGELARQIARLWVASGGVHRCATEARLVNSIDKAWANKGYDRDALLTIAAEP